MAKEGNAAPAVAAPKKGILTIVIAVVVAIAIGAGAATFLSGGKKKHRKGDVDEADESVKLPLVVFKDEVVVNLLSTEGEDHFIRVPKIELEVSSEAVAEKVEENRSKISDRISSTLRSKTRQDLRQAGGDLKLKEDLRKVINDTLEYKDERRGVREVILPGSFIVQ